MSKGEEEEQDIENLFEKIMKEHFPHLVKKINIHVQETQSPKQVGPKDDHRKTHQLKCQRLKIKKES